MDDPVRIERHGRGYAVRAPGFYSWDESKSEAEEAAALLEGAARTRSRGARVRPSRHEEDA